LAIAKCRLKDRKLAIGNWKLAIKTEGLLLGVELMTDPIADMLTRIRNAIAAKHSRVDIPASKLKLEIARILKEEGYINNFVIKGEGLKRTVRIFLRYDARGTSSITYLQRVSTPGRRVYVGSSDIPKVLGGYGINIVSTSRGLMSGKVARRENIGGELLAQIY
jgi:small subunit ribosomal protein S8